LFSTKQNDNFPVVVECVWYGLGVENGQYDSNDLKKEVELNP